MLVQLLGLLHSIERKTREGERDQRGNDVAERNEYRRVRELEKEYDAKRK